MLRFLLFRGGVDGLFEAGYATQLHIENECRIGQEEVGAIRIAITASVGDDNLTMVAFVHVGKGNDPTLNVVGQL